MATKMNTRQEVIDNLLTTTWYDRSRKDIIDGISKIRPFYTKMVEEKRIREKAPDGTHWEYPVRYAYQDQNIKYFGRGSTFGVDEKESLTTLKFYTKNMGTSIVRFWADEQKNKGKAKIISYVEEMLDNTNDSLENALATDLLSQNADPRAINALPTLIAEDPTSGNLGGLPRSDNAYLQNQTLDASGWTDTATDLLAGMTTMYNVCTEYKGGKRTKAAPDLILTTRRIYQDYEAIAEAYRQIVSNKSEAASLGFGDLYFKQVPVFWDPDCPAGKMYFLNTSTLEMPYDPDVWFDMTDWKWIDGTSLDRTAQILLVTNLICFLPAKNGVIYDISPTSS